MIKTRFLLLYLCAIFTLSGCGAADPEELCSLNDPEFEFTDTNGSVENYPPYSRPIFSEAQLVQYVPNRSIASCLARNLDNPDLFPTPSTDSAATWIRASQYYYFSGEIIAAEADIIGLDPNRVTSVSARLVRDSDNEIIATAYGTKIPGTAHRYSLSFNDAGDFTIDESKRMRIVGEFTIEDQFFEIGTPIQYYQTAVASLDAVGPAEVVDEHLEIPMYISTTELGIHGVKGNLYNADTGTPLIHLNANKNLTVENDVIVLQAHISALRAMGHEGPYELKDISLIRGASPPNYRSERGLITTPSAIIPQFPFSDYDDVP